MTTPEFVVIERLTHVTPFGLGLWDVASGRLTSDGLVVRVHTLSGTRIVRSMDARPNHHDLFVAQDFQNLRVFEMGAGDDEFWAEQSPPRPYLVEVRDPMGRYTPFVTHVALPMRGLAMPECVADLWPSAPSSPVSSVSPPSVGPPAYVPLFSTAARPVPARLAAVRATLINSVSGAPAMWAVLEVRYAGVLLSRGIADANGEVVAAFAYPEPPSPPPTPSGGTTTPQPLSKQSWPVEIVVRYDAGLTTYQPDPQKNAPLADLCDLLQQPLATTRTSSPPAPLTDATLLYGQELILGARDDGSRATLFIDPA